VQPGRCCPPATDGEIAAVNLRSARRRAWARFASDATLPGVAETAVELERLAAQFLGDLAALDRLEALGARFASMDDSPRAALVQADVASTLHRFDEARMHLERTARLGGAAEAIERRALTIDQARGTNPDALLAARRRIATASGRLEDLVPLAAALADQERLDEADTAYRQAFDAYDGMSPFPLAWVCFQLGMLWGEQVPVSDTEVAAFWYRLALAYLPGYVKARVHLAELCAAQDRAEEAEALLAPALASGDPEVQWRLADAMAAQGRSEEAAAQLDAARLGFDELLDKHLLAFADHAAEFYAGSGDDLPRALELARVDVANRATRRALRQLEAIAARIETSTASFAS
jgi:hypothetical protein